MYVITYHTRHHHQRAREAGPGDAAERVALGVPLRLNNNDNNNNDTYHYIIRVDIICIYYIHMCVHLGQKDWAVQLQCLHALADERRELRRRKPSKLRTVSFVAEVAVSFWHGLEVKDAKVSAPISSTPSQHLTRRRSGRRA